MTRTKWIFYTVLLGAAPIITRLLVMFLMKPGTKTVWFNAADFIGFGFALAVSNVNTLEHRQGLPPSWKTTHIGISIIGVLMFACVFGISCANESASFMNDRRFFWVSLLLALASTAHNYAVSDRLEKRGVLHP